LIQAQKDNHNLNHLFFMVPDGCGCDSLFVRRVVRLPRVLAVARRRRLMVMIFDDD
jgi:hypothetical protein